jgi:hypothetical protein
MKEGEFFVISCGGGLLDFEQTSVTFPKNTHVETWYHITAHTPTTIHGLCNTKIIFAVNNVSRILLTI